MQTLTPKALAEEWAKGKTRPVYYLCGGETALKETALKRLTGLFKPEAFNYSVRDAGTSDIAEALDEARTSPMLAETRFVVIKRTEKLKKDPLKKLLAYITAPCPSACLLVLADWPRTKTDPLPEALTSECALVDFSPMTPLQAVGHLNSKLLAGGVKTDSEALELLVELLGTGSTTLDGEAEKILLYMHGQNRVFTPQDVLALTGSARSTAPFELSKAVCEHRPGAAAEAAKTMLAGSEEPLALLVQTSRALEQMLKAKRLSASGEGAAACYQAGISPGLYFHLLKDSAAYTEEKLLRGLHRCLEAEELLKSSSKRDPGLVVRQLLYEITGTK